MRDDPAASYYVPNNTALIVTGDVMPDSVFALGGRVYGDWPRGADPFADAIRSRRSPR